MKGKRLLGYSIALICITAIVTFTLTITFSGVMWFADSGLSKLFTGDKIQKATRIIDEYYYQDADKQTMLDGAVSGLVASLGDPYSQYMSAEDYQLFTESVTGEYCGIGVVVTMDPEDKSVLIVSPIEDTPAFEVGLKTGDRIVKVNGEDIYGQSLDYVVSIIKGEADTAVNVDIVKADTGETVNLDIMRKNITLKTVKSEVLDGDIGYIRLTSFDEHSADEFSEHLGQLKSQSVKGIILDLRSNPGGIVDIAQEIASEFLPKDAVITYMEDKSGKREYVKSTGSDYDVPMVVLIDRGSASASEIVSGALRDNDRAALVGTTTYGKGLVQTLRPLGDGSFVKITISKYFTPNGEDINEKGITPEYVVEYDGSSDEDVQLDKAVGVLREMMNR